MTYPDNTYAYPHHNYYYGWPPNAQRNPQAFGATGQTGNYYQANAHGPNAYHRGAQYEPAYRGYGGHYGASPYRARASGGAGEPFLYPEYLRHFYPTQGSQPERRTPFTAHTPLWTGSGLHPALTASRAPKLIYDVRNSPRLELGTDTYMQFHDEPATRERVKHLRLISHQFPWTIDVEIDERSPVRYVSCSAVWKALYKALQEPLTDTEWALLGEDERSSLTEGASKDILRAPQRSDWLGKKRFFLGLAKDDEFAQKRVLPGKEPCESTWVVKFASHCD